MLRRVPWSGNRQALGLHAQLRSLIPTILSARMAGGARRREESPNVQERWATVDHFGDEAAPARFRYAQAFFIPLH